MSEEIEECIKLLQNKNMSEKAAYNFIIDLIIREKAPELLKDLYETNKIKLRTIIKLALVQIKSI